MSARMGIFQEMLYKQFGKHSKEALFYNVSLFFCFSWAGRAPKRVPSPPTLYSAQIPRITRCEAGAVPASRCVRPWMRSGISSHNLLNLLTSCFYFSPQHALPLPGFLLLAPNIYHHAVLFSQTGKCCTDGSLLLYLSVLWKMPQEAFSPTVV